MGYVYRLFVVAAGVCLLAFNANSASSQEWNSSNVVKVTGGNVRGAKANGIVSFKGIPFAAPPVVKLRWRAPQPVMPWSGELDAAKFKANCVQTDNIIKQADTSEDCLYLNVQRSATGNSKPRPVFVWIYGGALAAGGASLYPGEGIASQGVVFVSFNYRLNRFGFFAHLALAAESPNDPRGNYGHMDQIAVLKWVQSNIAAFGGDPSRPAARATANCKGR